MASTQGFSTRYDILSGMTFAAFYKNVKELDAEYGCLPGAVWVPKSEDEDFADWLRWQRVPQERLLPRWLWPEERLEAQLRGPQWFRGWDGWTYIAKYYTHEELMYVIKKGLDFLNRCREHGQAYRKARYSSWRRSQKHPSKDSLHAVQRSSYRYGEEYFFMLDRTMSFRLLLLLEHHCVVDDRITRHLNVDYTLMFGTKGNVDPSLVLKGF